MDDGNVLVHQQSSLSSDSNGDEQVKAAESSPIILSKRICLVGSVASNQSLFEIAQSFCVPVVTSATGEEYSQDKSFSTTFVLEDFHDDVFNRLYKQRESIVGAVALRQLAVKKELLPDNTRPLFNLSMTGVVVCFTGFRMKEDLSRLVPLVHHMGGSIRKDMSSKVTHLIANVATGEKYKYASTFRVPVVHQSWVTESWDYRTNSEFAATRDDFVTKHKLKPFYGVHVCFLGFQEDEEKHMTEILVANGGIVTNIEDTSCSHIVVERGDSHLADSASAPPPSKSFLSPTIANMTTSPVVMHPNFISTAHPQMQCTNKATLNTLSLATLHEKSNENLLDGNIAPKYHKKRKSITKLETPVSKRKKDFSYSEGTSKPISRIFRTPLRYLSHRRVSEGNFANETLNETVFSTSGSFDVTIASFKNFSLIKPTWQSCKNIKKSLFNTKSNKDSKLDFSELNNDCLDTSSQYPDLSFAPVCSSDSRHQFLFKLDTAGPLNHNAVVDESSVAEKLETTTKAFIVKAEWFWTSVQKQLCLDEKDYLFDDYIEQIVSPASRRDSLQATPGSASRRKRKRLQETLSSLAHHQQSPTVYKRRSSVSDAGLLSVSGSFLDFTGSPENTLNEIPEEDLITEVPRKGYNPRYQVFYELLQTERNYFNILDTIIKKFKKHLEEMPEEEALLNNTELKIIFGNLPPIHEVHRKMLDELKWTGFHWTDQSSIGNIILKYSADLLKAYPPFVNFFEEMKEMLQHCDINKPRFHAFLKACQTKPECGRQTLQDLLIRPVQRLPSISLLLNDILKHTVKGNPDHDALTKALAALKEVMTHINEDKRKTEGQRVMFDIFNEIDHCPPDLVSSHRSFITKAEVIQLSSSEGLSGKGSPLVIFLFSDQLEVCKKRSKAFNTLKSPNTVNGIHQKSGSKPYKHIKLMPLSTIKRVIDIKETEDCQRVFSLVIRGSDEVKEKLFSFVISDEDSDKAMFLKILCKQMATNACTADADKFLASLEPHQLEIDTSDISNGTFSKAFKFANRTRLKVGRAFSFNKTPSKLKRAVSSMMSPFGSSTNLTPATQLAQMRLASYSNLAELRDLNNADDSTPAPPMSVQPTRKMKTSSLGAAAIKRL